MKRTLSPAAMESLRASTAEGCALLKAMANQDRLLLLCQLTQGELCVSDLEELLDIHQPTLSQQLGVLREEGLVTTRRDGKNIYYQLASMEVIQIMDTLSKLFCGKALAAHK